ncbi:replication restart DNA helicase PriA [Tistlia consotensis]|uniref:Replication restart protein PriA n=1 Tax=Tistlia consotensis USBA 355 TaxID=560819 RepID=A0A1Y6BGT4_9PROT|nr:primosomal protein N' [Tistlia consotensis]SMF08370.1 replication restart DNA helicase PriA [Tistlia consotensis USBA 355]SNR35421.1 replication restart DNA helicase PriA [Tistlia consotensis]
MVPEGESWQGDGAPPDAAPAEAEAVRLAVLLPLPLAGSYSYLAPAAAGLGPGDLVLVPFGRRELWGVVWDRETGPDGAPSAEAALDTARLKWVGRRLPAPPLPEVSRRFVDWVAAYTLAAPGAVLRMVVSVSSALEPPKPQQAVRLVEPAPEGLRPTAQRRAVLEAASEGPARPAAELARAAGVTPEVVRKLVALGALETVELPAPPPFALPDWSRPAVDFSAAQAAAAEVLRGKVGAGFSATLLDGVTGSGKTEVYLEAVAAALARGEQALVLLPEIALSAQWLERFERRFGVAPAEWHSDLAPPQRRRTWRAVAEGEARVVVGARSALFLPYPALGVIVVDEEHDGAFKQEEGVIYHARDMAVVRASLGAIPVVLASATPSLETLVNVQAGKYAEVRLPDRHGGALLPEITAIDLRVEKPERLPDGNPGWLAPPLREALAGTLAAGEQALLFLNRRGYAPLTLCDACGHRLQCPHCTAWLVEHRFRGRLFCHHCGYARPLPPACPACGAEDSWRACGPGVERLLDEARLLFPEARVALASSDTLTGPRAAAELVERLRDREIDLLIGTQIVAKGHHFPHLTCVGVVDADLGLAGGDLRALERTWQLLQQVAGRAGRDALPGRVFLQSHDPDHPVIHALVAGDREGFLAYETEERRRGNNPPFTRLAAIILSDPDPRRVDGLARALARRAPRRDGLEVLGPTEAPLAVIRGRHRRRFLVRARRDLPLQRLLRDWLAEVKVPSSARLAVDIDPYSFF